MDIIKLKKIKRDTEIKINKLLNELSKETGCEIELCVDKHAFMGNETKKYITNITLTL